MKNNHSRRQFVKQSSALALGATALSGIPGLKTAGVSAGFIKHSKISVIRNEIILQGRRNNQAWFEPAIGIMPQPEGKLSRVFIRVTLLTGNLNLTTSK